MMNAHIYIARNRTILLDIYLYPSKEVVRLKSVQSGSSSGPSHSPCTQGFCMIPSTMWNWVLYLLTKRMNGWRIEDKPPILLCIIISFRAFLPLRKERNTNKLYSFLSARALQEYLFNLHPEKTFLLTIQLDPSHMKQLCYFLTTSCSP